MIAGALTGTLANALGAATAAPSPFLTLAGALLASGLVTAWFSARERRRSGEGPSNAADSMTAAAGRLAETAEGLLLPLRQQNAELTGQIVELRRVVADKTHSLSDAQTRLVEAQAELVKTQAHASNDRHDAAQELATLAAEVATLRMQLVERDERITTLEVAAGVAPDRRADHGT